MTEDNKKVARVASDWHWVYKTCSMSILHFTTTSINAVVSIIIVDKDFFKDY